jgi:hypothetical protein
MQEEVTVENCEKVRTDLGPYETHLGLLTGAFRLLSSHRDWESSPSSGAGWNKLSSFGSLEFSQAGTVRGVRVILSCGFGPLETVIVCVDVPGTQRTQRSLAGAWLRSKSLSVVSLKIFRHLMSENFVFSYSFICSK